MIGLVYLLVMGGHLLLSIWVVKLAVKQAGKHSKPGWYYGVPAGIVMFSLLYWDLIPTHAVHRYYCLVDGGFTVNKTLEEWKRENPGVAETLVPNNEPGAIITGNRRRYILNQRFIWDVYTSKHVFGIRKKDKRVVDVVTGETLATYIDFDTDIRALSLEPRNFRDLRLWLAANSCEMDGRKFNRRKFSEYLNAVKYR
ncbi:MAG: hypothetical protein KZQ88_11640 [Candidatus Thiodiazotropha sp. (ex Dulcina madagascariensis)]|nr:hypothetical protein [Candidatus Thiodiazotropha sp. (ex Dulcina madagascariensis)]MCU7926654.1 hypothetical protein [Candidatus Thiodiazotropha sp. (ex Dulcina madagascariensis)]